MIRAGGRKVPMPLIGWGTYKIDGPDIRESLDVAIQSGYRLIDTASLYQNEAEIGLALKEILPKYNCSRADIFITSKLGPSEQGPKCAEAVERSLEKLGTDYLDLYLIHWPGVEGMTPDDPRQADLRRQSWRTMEDLHEQGKLRAIGVSNYSVRQMKELFSYCKVAPAVLQTEYHPQLQRQELVNFCRSHDVHFQAYSSLGKQQLLTDETVLCIAAEIGRTPAQVLLRWAIQQDISVLPKSKNPVHIRENIKISDFEVSDKQMEALSAQETGVHYAWNPDAIS